MSKFPKPKACPLCGSAVDLMFTPAMDMGGGYAENPHITCLNCTLSLTGAVLATGRPGDVPQLDIDWANRTLIERWNNLPRRRKKVQERKYLAVADPTQLKFGKGEK